MANSSRPIPLLDVGYKPRPLCPVCGSVSYSAAGMHPQCSMIQHDEKRMQRMKKRSAPKAASVSKQSVMKAWHRQCPRCKAQTHFRKAECACGYEFHASAGDS